MIKINPFKPNSPTRPGMFVGRLQEIIKLETSLMQTKAGNPVNFILTGERGIGKTSLLNYFKWVADGSIDLEGQKFNFLVIETDIDQNTTQIGLIKKIELGLRMKLGQTETARSFFTNAWAFLKRLEINGCAIKETSIDSDLIFEEFSYSLADTINRITDESKNESVFNAKYDGLILLIDESDKCSKELNFGTLTKLLLERLQRNGCEKVMIGLAGLPEIRKILIESHPSALRIFEEIQLDRLDAADVSRVIDMCIEKANIDNQPTQITIQDNARNLLVNLSEGYPHFIQQFGYSAFENDTDNIIDENDVMSSAFGKRGALNVIGDRYYRDNFYNKIQKDSYRQVLRIMAENSNEWVTKKQIKDNFKGSATTLDNALNALRSRHIILTDETERGKYRLQHRGFAYWIKMQASEPSDLAPISRNG